MWTTQPRLPRAAWQTSHLPYDQPFLSTAASFATFDASQYCPRYDIKGFHCDNMNHLPQAWGRPRDEIYGAYDASHLQTTGPKTHTQSPVVTGTSVVACKFKDGIVIAADQLASYGSLARFTDVKRLRPFNSRVILGFGGDMSDMQALDRTLESLFIREQHSASGAPADDASSGAEALDAKNLHMYLSKVMYKRRSEMNPLWNVIVVAGLDGANEPFLASVDLLGTTFSSPTIATGFGAHLAQPILRKRVPDEEAAKTLERHEAVELVKSCMKVLYYRDARSLDKYSIAVCEKSTAGTTKGQIDMKEDETLENQSWAFAETIRGYGTQVN